MDNHLLSRLEWDATALIIIDMQRDFCAPGGYADQAGLDIRRLSGVIERIHALLDAARTADLLVVYTREGHTSDLSDCSPAKLRRSLAAGAAIGTPGPMGRLLVRGEHGHGIIDELQPLPHETVIDKPGYGAFYCTTLQEVLQKRSIRTLILCGVTTEVCVHSTLREAVDRGYLCLTVADACAASNPALQQPALDMIGVEAGIFGKLVTAEAVLGALSQAGFNLGLK